jgi:peroxiredoxin
VEPLISKVPGLLLFGLSTQSTGYQAEVASRLHLPFPILSDEALCLTRAIHLPFFRVAEMTLLKRMTLLLVDGKVRAIDYPIFPSNIAAKRALSLLDSI